jgi:hypothetical protein
MAYTNTNEDRHLDHEVYVDLFPRDKKGQLITKHPAALRCRTCNKWIKWLGLKQLAQLEDLTEEQ